MERFCKIFTRLIASLAVVTFLAIAGIIVYTCGWLKGYDARGEYEAYQEQLNEEYAQEHPEGFRYYEWVQGREAAE